ncbi:MAG: LysR family transcriptional regulator [Bdellovibrionales bacterium]
MNLFKKEFYYFFLLAETESVSKAAELAGIQQSGMSKALRNLEDQSGMDLFTRANRGIKLNQNGKSLLSSLQKAQQQWDSAKLEAIQQSEEIRGVIRLGAHSSIAMNHLGKEWVQFLEKNPFLDLRLSLCPSSEVTKKVLNYDLDLGIVANPVRHPDLVIQPMKKEYIQLWSSAKKTNYDVVYYNQDMIEIFSTLKKMKFSRRIEINDYEIIAKSMKHSNALAILPNSIAERYTYLKPVGKPIKTVSICLINHHQAVKTLAFKECASVIKKAR